MKSILFISTVYRTGEKVYPVLPALSKKYNIEVLNISQMSPESPWDGDFDMRNIFYKMCEDNNIRMVHGPGISEDGDKTREIYRIFMNGLEERFKDKAYDLVIFDNNVTQKRIGLSYIYKWCNKRGIKVVGTPHGNKEFKSYRVVKRMGRMFDYSFVFGEKEKQGLLKYSKNPEKQKHLLFPAGIPSNDKLKQYKRGNKYILVIPNFTEPLPKGITDMFLPLDRKSFDAAGIMSISKDYGYDVLIKEKNHLFHKPTSFRKSFKNEPSVHFMLDCEDDNQLIADAAIVISAPSTMAFKSIQMGIPTVLLKKRGAIGNFKDYPGLVNCTEKEVRKEIKNQIRTGKCEKFIKETLEGGLTFNSIDIHVKHISKLL